MCVGGRGWLAGWRARVAVCQCVPPPPASHARARVRCRVHVAVRLPPVPRGPPLSPPCPLPSCFSLSRNLTTVPPLLPPAHPRLSQKLWNSSERFAMEVIGVILGGLFFLVDVVDFAQWAAGVFRR